MPAHRPIDSLLQSQASRMMQKLKRKPRIFCRKLYRAIRFRQKDNENGMWRAKKRGNGRMWLPVIYWTLSCAINYEENKERRTSKHEPTYSKSCHRCMMTNIMPPAHAPRRLVGQRNNSKALKFSRRFVLVTIFYMWMWETFFSVTYRLKRNNFFSKKKTIFEGGDWRLRLDLPFTEKL